MSDIKEELLQDKEFLKGIVTEIARDKSMRHLLLQSVIKETATKDDLRDLKEYIDARINDLYKHIGVLERSINERFLSLDKRITTFESSVNARLDALDKRIDGLDKRINSLDKRIDTLENSINARIDSLRWMMMIFFTIFSIILSILTFFVSTLLPK